MSDYSRLNSLVTGMDHASSDHVFKERVIPYLVDAWLDDYDRSTSSARVVETTVGGFSYLFDIEHQRLIAAWGISQGRHGAPRDKSRMAGHPLGAGALYHRGHAIPHTLGGPTDINLVPQLGAVNVGAFRRLEREAVATPGALYFTHWSYGRSDTQTPTGVEQGLLCPGAVPRISRHAN
jgi:hypothetical protein